MKNLKTVFLWTFMFGKRLLKNASFITIILLIPISVFFMGMVLKGDSGILTVCLTAEDPNDEFANKLIKDYLDDSGIIVYKTAPTPEEARKAVENGKADAAWIFSADLADKMYKYAAKENTKPFVTVVEREITISLRLSHLVLFEKIYPYLSYDIYDSFVRTEMDVTDDEVIRENYENNSDLSEIVRIEYMNGDYGTANAETGFISSPLRGMLSLAVMMCTIAAAMLFIHDRKTGKYDWLKPVKHFVPAMGICLSASVISGLALFAAVYAAGINTVARIEIITIIEYIFATAAFGTLLCVVFRSEGLVGSLLPVFILVMLAITPIFFSFSMLKPLKLIFPPYYYLNAIVNPSYLTYMAVYIPAVYLIAFLLHYIFARRNG